MYFDVYVNGKRIGSFGHADVENLSVSVSGAKDGHYLFAGVVCREDGKQFHYSWPQFELSASDEVRIVPSDGSALSEPERKYEMGRTERKAWEKNVCEFCQRNETQVERLIAGDRNRPGICSECVELCNAILKNHA
ncbi:MAG TPA: ClpX C4-type zinc finger protein [Woeseiaceae bacterium]|nr:ClpX C4-type zinc finger protein [Woeseiaceae bacterium]